MSKDKYPNIFLIPNGGCCVYYPSDIFNFTTCALLKLGTKGGGGGVLPEKLGGGVQSLPKTLTLFMTKICSFPCRICRDAKIKIWEIANYNVTFFDSKNVVQSKDMKTTIPKNTKNRPKYVRKM